MSRRTGSVSMPTSSPLRLWYVHTDLFMCTCTCTYVCVCVCVSVLFTYLSCSYPHAPADGIVPGCSDRHQGKDSPDYPQRHSHHNCRGESGCGLCPLLLLCHCATTNAGVHLGNPQGAKASQKIFGGGGGGGGGGAYSILKG